ncbi:MAG: hypothetical protein HY056_17610 [Proteobacteria bacterium]|nr:hypothetical protein [Pseudomonadota bacterium]
MGGVDRGSFKRGHEVADFSRCAAWQGVAFDTWYRSYAGDEMREVKFCLAFLRPSGTLHWHSKKIESPENLRTLKIHAPNAMLSAWIAQLGGYHVPAEGPQPRVLRASELDAVLSSWETLSQLGIDKIMTKHLDARIFVSPLAWVLNRARYERLTAAHKGIIDAHCAGAWATRIAGAWAQAEQASIATLRARPNHEVVAISAAQDAAWRRSAAPLRPAWALRARGEGHDSDAVLAKLIATLADGAAGARPDHPASPSGR